MLYEISFQVSFSRTSLNEHGISVPLDRVRVPASFAPCRSTERSLNELSATSNRCRFALTPAANRSNGCASLSGAEKQS